MERISKKAVEELKQKDIIQIDDIYMISDLITQQDDIKVIEVKDYIKNPKPNGYRSYHMIVEIPVFFAKGKTPMRVELQI